MNILAVRPSYQRQGLGTMLLAPGLELADNANAKTYIEASRKGKELYLKHGWVEVDEMMLDLSVYGGDKEGRIYS
jgi:GNAT superfamily N-acetyltransferase